MNLAHRLTSWVILSCVLVAGRGVMAQTVSEIQQLRVQWITSSPAAARATGQPVNPLRLLETVSASGSLPRQRNLQVSTGHLVVHAIDGGGVLIDRQLILDPRVVRAESPGPSGELTGEVLQRVDPDFLIAVPKSPAVVEVRLYQPRWSGSEFVLQLVGSIELR